MFHHSALDAGAAAVVCRDPRHHGHLLRRAAIFTAKDAMQLAAYSAVSHCRTYRRAFVHLYHVGPCDWSKLLMLFFARSQQYKTLGKLTTVPALFGISEPLVFGTPMVFNFRFAIPFIFMNAITWSLPM